MARKIRYTFTDIDTDWTQVAITTPARYTIIRARAEIISGSGTKVALRVKEADTAYDIDTVLEYDIGTVSHPLDSMEDIQVVPLQRDSVTNNNTRTYFAVKCDTGTDNLVKISIDIEI
jgi:hypothetical protein